MEEECERAKTEGNGFLLQGDLNAWLEPAVLPGDTKQQNQNEKQLVKFVETNKLVIVNCLPICQGTTTWSRIRKGTKLTSTIDFFIVCQRVFPFVQEMVIDTKRSTKLPTLNMVKIQRKQTMYQ